MSLIITSGYTGSTQLIPTSGYGISDNSIKYFLLDSAELPSPNVLRARFSRKPNTSGINIVKGNFVANWTLVNSDNVNIPIQVASVFIGDDEVIDLTLFSDLLPGSYTLTVAATVQSADLPIGFTLANTSVPFELTEVQDDPISHFAQATTSFTAGSELAALASSDNSDEDFQVCFDSVNKLFNPAYRGKDGWKQLIAAIAKGDCNVSTQAKNTYDQFFTSSASGRHLTTRGHDYMVPRPANTGMHDEPYRDLIISTSAEKLTQISLLRALSVFYGLDATHAFAETENQEPYAIDDGQKLNFLVDEHIHVEVVFNRQDFQIIRRAKAVEVAAVINRAIELYGANAFAVSQNDTVTGGTTVKIYSGTLGLGSVIKVVGGTAQNALQFPANRFPAQNPMPALPSWQVMKIGSDKVRMVTSSSFFNVGEVQVGDYVVVNGLEFNAANRGTFQIKDVYFSNSVKYIEFDNEAGVNQAIVNQIDYKSVNIFEQKKLTPYDYHRYVTVSQMAGISKVSIPVTTAIVAREKYEAAYLNSNAAIPFSSLTRNPDGTTTIIPSLPLPAGVKVGSVFTVDSFVPQVTLPPAGSAGGGTYSSYNEASGKGYDSSVSRLSLFGYGYHGMEATIGKDGDKAVWLVGGNTAPSGGARTPKNTIEIFEVWKETVTTDLEKTHHYKLFKNNVAAPLPSQHNMGASLAFRIGAPLMPIIAGGYTQTPWSGISASPTLSNVITQATRKKPRQTVLVLSQLTTTPPLPYIPAAVPIWFTTNPSVGHTLTVSRIGVARNYTFGPGGGQVPIGATVFDTLTNLTAAINADGLATFGAVQEFNFQVGEFPVANAIVIIEDALTPYPSIGLRVHGSGGFTSICSTVDYYGLPDYRDGVGISLPATDPLHTMAGFSAGGVSDKDVHEVLGGIGNVFRQWDSSTSSWLSNINWVTTSTTGNLATPVAEATSLFFNDTTLTPLHVVTGGITIQNKATTLIQGSITPTNMKVARCHHSVVKLNATDALIIGGRQPAKDDARATQGYSNWNFEDAFGAVQYAGPVNVTVGTSNRVAGKIGYGVALSGLTKPISIGGAGQTALNTQLLGQYTISGWMTNSSGCVFHNGVPGTSGAQADNTLISFGILSSGRFYVGWRHYTGSGFVNIVKETTATAASLMPISSLLKYYHFAITKTIPIATPTLSQFSLYINGALVQAWDADLSPNEGANSRWAFGEQEDNIDVTIGGYGDNIDSIGITSTILTDTQIMAQYLDEVGVMYDEVFPYNSSVGSVLSSCEVLTTSTGYSTGSMTTGRFACGAIKLPDGRVLVAGGVGFNPTTELAKAALPQRSCELKSAEIWSPELGYWAPIADMLEPHSYCSMGLSADGKKVYIMGGFSSRKVEYLDLRTMQWSISRGSYDWEANPYLKERTFSGGAVLGDTIVLAGGAYINTDGNYQTEERQFSMSLASEFITGGGLNKEHVVTALNGNNITFKTPNHPFWTTTAVAGGTVTFAIAATGENAGPFIYDPKGITITDKSATINQRLEVGHQYSLIDVGANQATNFPKEAGGWVTFNFGYKNQTPPIKYLGKISNSTIIIDAKYVFKELVEVGDNIRFVDKNAFNPDDSSEIGAFWLTASSSGRVSAVQTLNSISAFGIPLAVTVRYPGDRGLGGQGRPVRGSYKLSDIVSIFANDDVDAEMEAARNE